MGSEANVGFVMNLASVHYEPTRRTRSNGDLRQREKLQHKYNRGTKIGTQRQFFAFVTRLHNEYNEIMENALKG